MFNLKTDRTEQHNLAAKNPAEAKELAAKWEAWAKRANVEPGPRAKQSGTRKQTNAEPE